MELRTLGNTGIRVSLLGLGTVKFGRNTNLKYPHAFALPSDAAITRLLAEARELGINLIDTAPAYGSSEERLGRLLPGARTDWVLSTKVGENYDGKHSRFDFSAASTRASITASRERLRTDYLDLVSVHSDGNDLPILEQGECLGALRDAQTAGDIRAIGFSAKTIAGGLAAARVCDVVMITLPEREPRADLVLTAARREHRGVLVKKALGSGYLTDSPRRERLAELAGIACVHSVVVGTLDPLHLRDNADAIAAGARNAGRNS